MYDYITIVRDMAALTVYKLGYANKWPQFIALQCAAFVLWIDHERKGHP